MNLKIGVVVMLVGIVMIGMTATSVSATPPNCKVHVTSCQNECTTQGQCQSGEYSGILSGCDNGDPRVVLGHVGDADRYLRSRGYSVTAWVAAYGAFPRDYTRRIDPDGDCRWQAQRSHDNRRIVFKDGPEPNPQPRFFGNGNLDLWNPFGCERNSIEDWHRRC